MTSRRFLFLLLVFVAADFAVPYELTARGWYEYEDEEEGGRPEPRRVERPADCRTRAVVTAPGPRPTIPGGHPARPQHPTPVTRLARGDTSSPSTSPEAH